MGFTRAAIGHLALTVAAACSAAVLSLSALAQTPATGTATVSSTGDETFPLEVREFVLLYMNRIKVVGDGIDAIDEGALSQVSTRYGVSWWEVFGTLMVAESVGADLLKKDYSGALLKLSSYSVLKLLGQNRALDQLLGAGSIANLAALPIDIALNTFADAVSEAGFQYQIKAYYAARSAPLNMSHDAIMQQQMPGSQYPFTYDNFGYLRIVNDLAPKAYQATRPDTRMERDEVYAAIQKIYEAERAAMRLVEKRRQAVAEYRAVAYAEEAPVTRCDELAADPWDPHRVSAGVGKYASDFDWDMAIETCLTAVDNYPNSLRLRYQLGRVFVMNSAYRKAFEALEKPAESGYMAAQALIGFLYANGLGVEENTAKGIKLNRLVAEQGSATAQFNLGSMYYFGTGVTQDYAEAMKWFLLAAEQGFDRAQYQLGNMYSFGEGVTRDYAEAVKWYRLAALQGDFIGQFFLASMYKRGNGVTQDYAEAMYWYRQAAANQVVVFASVYLEIGEMYYKGQGVSKDFAEAAKWFRMAAEQGDPGAEHKLSQMYERGVGVELDIEQALFWFQKWVDSGSYVVGEEGKLQELKKRVATEKWREFMESIFVSMESFISSDPIIDNVADLIEYDKTRFILAFQSSRKIRMIYNNPSFVGGKLIVQNVFRKTDYLKEVEGADTGGFKGWDNWFEMTQSVGSGRYTVSCLIDPSDASGLKEGEPYVFDAVMKTFSGNEIVFECER